MPSPWSRSQYVQKGYDVEQNLMDVDGATQALRQFADERDWQPFHSPKNLVMALSGEVGELTEIFQWMTEADSHTAASAPQTAKAVRDELADVTLYLIRLADVLGVDLNAAIASKLAANAVKYPVETSRGTSTKYDQLPQSFRKQPSAST
ncbi:NTP pyrophosphatase (non-canonical NTP hydrolase) [Comamonas sp. BIGb0124]|nr:NTP pyrophosphatase (non-canonical NTP hydrolase) [Comamonas sp. BIGb0124]